MSRSPVFNRVSAAACNRRGYNSDLHERVDNLIQEWVENTGSIGYAVSENAYQKEVESCQEYVAREYRQRYGLPIIGILFWPIIYGIISWIVQRTLDWWFPRAGSDD